MSVKAEVLAILEANREEHISGEELASRLQVSRTSIWKAIKALREEVTRSRRRITVDIVFRRQMTC